MDGKTEKLPHFFQSQVTAAVLIWIFYFLFLRFPFFIIFLKIFVGKFLKHKIRKKWWANHLLLTINLHTQVLRILNFNLYNTCKHGQVLICLIVTSPGIASTSITSVHYFYLLICFLEMSSFLESESMGYICLEIPAMSYWLPV